MLYAGVWVAAVFDAPDGVAAGLVYLGGFAYLCVLAIAMAVALEIRQEKRSGGKLPWGQAPVPGGQASRHLPPESLGRPLPPGDPRRWPNAQTVLRRRLRPSVPVRGHWARDGTLAAGTAPASACMCQ